MVFLCGGSYLKYKMEKDTMLNGQKVRVLVSSGSKNNLIFSLSQHFATKKQSTHYILIYSKYLAGICLRDGL